MQLHRGSEPPSRRGSGRLRTSIIVTASALLAIAVVFGLAWAIRPPALDSATAPFGVPTVAVIVSTLVLLAIVALGVLGLEALATLPQLRAARRPDPPPPDMAIGSGRITVLVPAHDEAARIHGTLESLRTQARRADRVVVVADNCSDATPEIASAFGATVIRTRDNSGRKAGALNQALAMLLPTTQPRDLILVMDADTHLSPGFIESAATLLETDGDLAAVGGIFHGDPGPGILAQLQRNEFARYARQIRTRRGRVSVLTGTATLFRASVLESVATSRGGALPGVRGRVYEEQTLTEDNELTLAIKALGRHVISPAECVVTTELMPTLSDLWTQRLRWQRGALENLSEYGIQAATAKYWMQQWGIAYGSVALMSSLIALAVLPLLMGSLVLIPFWLIVAVAFSLERGITVWDAGWKGRILAFTLLPEIAYDLYLQACFIRAVAGLPRSREVEWGHLRTPIPEAST